MNEEDCKFLEITAARERFGAFSDALAVFAAIDPVILQRPGGAFERVKDLFLPDIDADIPQIAILEGDLEIRARRTVFTGPRWILCTGNIRLQNLELTDARSWIEALCNMDARNIYQEYGRGPALRLAHRSPSRQSGRRGEDIHALPLPRPLFRRRPGGRDRRLPGGSSR